MYYGLFIRVGHKYVRVDTTHGYTIDTARHEFRHLVQLLVDSGVQPHFRPLPPVKQVDPYTADHKYAKTPW